MNPLAGFRPDPPLQTEAEVHAKFKEALERIADATLSLIAITKYLEQQAAARQQEAPADGGEGSEGGIQR